MGRLYHAMNVRHDEYENNTFQLWWLFPYSEQRKGSTPSKEHIMLVLYIVFTVAALLGSAIAWDEFKDAA